MLISSNIVEYNGVNLSFTFELTAIKYQPKTDDQLQGLLHELQPQDISTVKVLVKTLQKASADGR